MTYQQSHTSFANGFSHWAETAGTTLKEGLSTREILEASNTLYNVEKRQVAIQTPSGGYVKSPHHYATVRTDTNQILGTVGGSYAITQNRAALEILEAGGDRLKVLAAGALDNGAKSWFYAKVADTTQEIIKGDPTQSYVLLHTDHTGRGALEVLFTSVRMVCSNQMSMIRNQAGRKNNVFKIRHSGNVEHKISQAAKIFGGALEAHRDFGEQMKFLASQPVTSNEMDGFLKLLVPDPSDDKNPQRAINKREALTEHIMGGRGQSMRGISGTRYGALQGISHWATWCHEESDDHEKRLKHAWFGGGDSLVQKAREVLLSNSSLAA